MQEPDLLKNINKKTPWFLTLHVAVSSGESHHVMRFSETLQQNFKSYTHSSKVQKLVNKFDFRLKKKQKQKTESVSEV